MDRAENDKRLIRVCVCLRVRLCWGCHCGCGFPASRGQAWLMAGTESRKRHKLFQKRLLCQHPRDPSSGGRGPEPPAAGPWASEFLHVYL